MRSSNEDTPTLYYAEIQTDLLGQIRIASTERGICCLRFDEDSASFITHLATQVITAKAPSIMHSYKKTKPYTAAIKAYLEKHEPIPETIELDLHQMTPFQQQILEIVRRIPYSATTTYGEIADQIDNPNASRAIGQVLRRNPIPIIIPCHRVISSDGTLGGYGGVIGSRRKITLLKHEGVILA